ncbi:MAG TPA: transcription-repair coupling factor [Candidatus Binataceae bacterium]|jgi:transcription-repair coupling factor (superfamily II helicase)|nr:transcription-repair coupling factor [Candidatus Binataceae bacterium]
MERSLKEAVGELEARLRAGAERHLPIMGLKGAAGPLLLREAALTLKRPILAVTPLSSEAESLAAEVGFFLGESPQGGALERSLYLHTGWEVTPLARITPPLDNQSAEFVALYALLRKPAPLVITSVEALMTRAMPRSVFENSVLSLTLGDCVDLDGVVSELAAIGYQRLPQTEEPGDFSVRGGIVDLFSPLYNRPLRLELEDDVLSSIRFFDSADQRSLGEVLDAIVIPARFVAPGALRERRLRDRVELRGAEIGLVRKEVAELTEALENGLLFPGVENLMPYMFDQPLETLFDYLPQGAVTWLVEPGRITAQAQRFADRIAQEAEQNLARHAYFPSPETLYLDAADLQARLDRLLTVDVGSVVTVRTPQAGYAPPIEVKSQQSLKLTAGSKDGAKTLSFEPLAAELTQIRRGQSRAVFVVDGPSQGNRLRRHLEAYGFEINSKIDSFPRLLEAESHLPAIIEGEIAAGTVLQLDGLYIYSEEDIFGEPRVRRRSRPAAKGILVNLEELKPSDIVVHLDHGIGRYRGLKHLKVANTEGDFLNLEYAGDDTLYVPVERINLVQRYVGGDSVTPKLDKLGSGSWDKVKKRTRETVLAMASELLEVYAAREAQKGHGFPHPGAEYEEFADRFEFQETEDQLAAIDQVLLDMSKPRPMDRLICGDAGFGKTEIALRAAMVAVADSYQVAMLVPTTVLAEQHFETFKNRFKDVAVRIEMVSRFRSARENKAVLQQVREGKVDIVIGTHRLLQNDVDFKRLGLLIIDEEHRFGVADKEKIKKFRKLVDVLTMTGTPIPRTLHMAMLGIRDLSIIQTPPVDRQAIHTYVAHFDDGLIREVVLRELNRGGQVFFVHNRVENIDYMARHLRALVPEAKVAIAHGQMEEHELEVVMHDFINKHVNVLVCSAIIESGLDIPNANTIIINRADHFGLAQLYQLRGRVGRSKQKAYAYLLVPGEHLITRDAKRRIEVLRELVEVGGGFKLAMHDLELRGAGNLLGREQSGEVTAVGFELYTEMMEQAIRELRGEPERPDFEPELQLGIPAYIPDSYAPDESERLILYRRMARAESVEDFDDLRDELRDRFGPVPTLVENLLRAMNVRRQMRELLIMSAMLRGNQLQLRFHPQAPLDAALLTKLVNANRSRMRLAPNAQLTVHLENRNYEELFEELEPVLQALAACEKVEPRVGRVAGQLAN